VPPFVKGRSDIDDTETWVQITKRTGWVRKGVQGPESIADHMYRMGIMAMIAGQPDVDSIKCAPYEPWRESPAQAYLKSFCLVRRCLKLALVHDLAEGLAEICCKRLLVFTWVTVLT
jgi:HD domain